MLFEKRRLMHRAEHAAPARSRRQMRRCLKNPRQTRPESACAVVVAAGEVHRPIDQKWAAHNGVAIDETPVAAVLAAIAIVAHRKKLVGRHNNLVTLNMILDM